VVDNLIYSILCTERRKDTYVAPGTDDEARRAMNIKGLRLDLAKIHARIEGVIALA